MNYTRNETEKRKAEQYFSRKKINPEDIKSFCFMQNHKFWVGPSIMALQLRSGKTKMLPPKQNRNGSSPLFIGQTDTFQQLCSTSKTYSNNTGKELLEHLEYTIRRFLYSSVTCFGIYNAESLLTRAFR